MESDTLAPEIKRKLLTAQKNEITEYHIYKKLSKSTKDPHNRDVLSRIGDEELEHYHFWKEYTHEEITPNRLKTWLYYLIARIFGITFSVKLMEKGEEDAQITYEKIAETIPEASKIVEDEDEHEEELIALIDEERLRYVGSIVLGLNDALVELTGALAGFTLALQNTELIAITGLITGIAASLSMGTSEYLSTKSEESEQSPVKASIYTGSAYILTVFFLIFPFLLFANLYLCLGVTIFNAIVVIFIFTFYISVAKDAPFKKRFSEMASMSLGIAAITFVIGFAIRQFLGVSV